jgi:hypothetical protein
MMDDFAGISDVGNGGPDIGGHELIQEDWGGVGARVDRHDNVVGSENL